jgi:hypothetical protein
MGKIELLTGNCYGEVFHNEAIGTIIGHGSVFSYDDFENHGIVEASWGNLILTAGGTLNNHSTGVLSNRALASLHIKPESDVINLGNITVMPNGGVAFDCNLVNEPNGIIQLNGGALVATTITQTADANFAGFGGITGDVVIESGGLIQLTGPTNIVGDVNIATNATLEISDGVTLVTGHTTNNGTIHMKGGRLIPQGGITNNGNVIWEPGTYNNVADFNLDGHVNFKDFADFADTWLWQAQL